jgi:hypothetical protein
VKAPTGIAIVMGLIVLWALADVARSYPSTFHPRFWDEAIYMPDVTTPGALLAPEQGKMRYAPSKPGYGLPLAGMVKLFGDNGAMYLSSACWLLAITILSIMVFRNIGSLPGMFTAASLTYSPLLGKYVAEAGPTLLAAFFFILLWIVYPRRNWWAAGLVFGCIALIDAKWIPPLAISVLAVEMTIERNRHVRERALFLGGAGLMALFLVGATVLLHPAFGDYLWSYVTRHRRIVGFEPSAIFGYYLVLFGAMPAMVVAAISVILQKTRQRLKSLPEGARKLVEYALVFGGVPIIFYSLFGELKALRFFAVEFPLLVVPISVGVAALVGWLLDRTTSEPAAIRHATVWTSAAVLAGIILIGSDGPAYNLRIQNSFPAVLQRLEQEKDHDGVISSYIWPVAFYGRPVLLHEAPFTLTGVSGEERWLAFDPMLDRVTIEARLALDKDMKVTPDSLWGMQRTLRSEFCDSVFAVPSDFYASDYFMSEQAVSGIPTLRRWCSYRRPAGNFCTIYRIDQTRLWRSLNR